MDGIIKAVATGIVLALLAGLLGVHKSCEDQQPERDRRQEAVEHRAGPEPEAPRERGPWFSTPPVMPAREAKFADLAMREVYDRCSAAYVFREGSTIAADYQRSAKGRVFSNVEIKLWNPDKARGHTLWYQVFFKAGRPAAFQATKSIAAELCGIPGPDVEVDL